MAFGVSIVDMEEKSSQKYYKQLQTLSYFPMSQSHEPAIKLAEKLNEWLGESMLFSSQIVVQKRTKQLLK